MLVNIERLDRALDTVLEAAVDTSLWPRIIEDVRQATSAFGVNILPMTGIFPGGMISTESLGPALEGYFDGGWNHNEWRVRGLPRLRQSGSVLEQTYSSRDDFENRDYYRAQSKYGIGRTCIVDFGVDDNILCFTLHRRLDEEPFREAEETVFQAMRERLTAANRMMRALECSRIDGMADAFEIGKMPAIFFDRKGKVTRVNGAAQLLLGPDLQVSNGRLVCRSPVETARLQRRMDAVTSALWLSRPSGPIAVTRQDKHPLGIRVQRLGSGLGDVFADTVGVCLIEDSNQASDLDELTLISNFKLTSRQAEIALLLTHGRSLQSIADEKRISYETAKTHLRAIFDRTGTRRQSELVALLSRRRF